jgi:molybdopterin-guanine dinucleotide biosynthesis protein A
MMSSIVLAGGEGKRLGRGKIWETIGQRSLIERVIDCLAPLSDEILIVAASKSEKETLASKLMGGLSDVGQPTPLPLNLLRKIKVITDIYPGKGALGGLYTGLVASSSFHSLVVAADMPFLSPSLLDYLIRLSSDFDVVIPQVQGMLEPLHAVYSKDCLPWIEKQIAENNLKVSGFLDKVKVRYIGETEIDRFDAEHLSFFNVNTLADLEKAKQIAFKVSFV